MSTDKAEKVDKAPTTDSIALEVSSVSTPSPPLPQLVSIPLTFHNDKTKEEVEAMARAHRFIHRHEPMLQDYMSKHHRGGCRGGCRKNCDYCRFNVATFFYLVRSFWSLLITWTTLWVLALSIAATAIFMHYKITSNLVLTLITNGVVFPISFLVSFAVGRRERISLDMADIKSAVLELYFISREWPKPHRSAEFSNAMRSIMQDLLTEMAKYLSHKRNGDIFRIYSDFDHLHHLVENIRREDQDFIKSIVGTAYQYIRLIIADFERLRTVSDYRTPSVFRAFTLFWLTLFPVLFAPYYVFLAAGVWWVAIFNAVLSALVLVLLYSAVDQLEDPFDGNGVDDFNLEMLKEPLFYMFNRNREDVDYQRKMRKAAKIAEEKKEKIERAREKDSKSTERHDATLSEDHLRHRGDKKDSDKNDLDKEADKKK